METEIFQVQHKQLEKISHVTNKENLKHISSLLLICCSLEEGENFTAQNQLFVWVGCDVITVMVFHWGSSLNEDIKAVGCFYMRGGLMWGGHSGFKSSVMHNERTHKYTGTQSHTQMSIIFMLGSLNSPHVYFVFSVTFTQTLTCPSFSLFLCICALLLSQGRLVLIFMSLAWHAYYYYHYCYYAFQGREVILGQAEVVQKQELRLLRLSDWSDLWFMQQQTAWGNAPAGAGL